MMKLWRHAAAFLLSLCAAATMAAAADTPPVPLTEEAFPDPAFLQRVGKKDSDGDGSLSQEELDAVTAMDLRKQGIEQLDGLEYFRNLESLNCSENDLTALVLEDFPALTSLTCNENASLETLDLSGVPALEQLYCFHSALTELDLQDVPALTYLAWGGSPLQELDLSNSPELQVLHVLGGDLADADLSHNPKLDMLLWNHPPHRNAGSFQPDGAHLFPATASPGRSWTRRSPPFCPWALRSVPASRWAGTSPLTS